MFIDDCILRENLPRDSTQNRYGMCLSCADGLNVNQSCSARDFCSPLDPCSANSVSCTSTASGALCTCQPGYSGATCQHDIDECASQPCQNGAECLDMIDEYMCNCSLGFSGQPRTCRRRFLFCFVFVVFFYILSCISSPYNPKGQPFHFTRVGVLATRALLSHL